MSLDLLQEKIRKLKNPVLVDFSFPDALIPPEYLQQGSLLQAREGYTCALMDALSGGIAGVRFDLGFFSLMGAAGIELLQRLLQKAREAQLYVILDGPQLSASAGAQTAAKVLFAEGAYLCDAVAIGAYIGSDAIKPFVSAAGEDKALFVTVRSANRSAAELQDLLTGSRHVWSATAETVSRLGEQSIGKSGYSRICAIASATSSESLRQLRAKHNRLFLLVDGVDLPGGNAKNASLAFDRFGHGAALCVSTGITGAWIEEGQGDAVAAAQEAAERIKKNITRYVGIL